MFNILDVCHTPHKVRSTSVHTSYRLGCQHPLLSLLDLVCGIRNALLNFLALHRFSSNSYVPPFSSSLCYLRNAVNSTWVQ